MQPRSTASPSPASTCESPISKRCSCTSPAKPCATELLMSRVAVITRLELVRRIRNRSAVVTAFVAPLAIGTVFGVLIGGASHAKFTIAVVDSDRSQISQGFVEAVTSRPRVSKDPVRFRTLASQARARHAVDNGDVDAATVIPAHFGATVTQGR